jgi:hypothetical protein
MSSHTGAERANETGITGQASMEAGSMVTKLSTIAAERIGRFLLVVLQNDQRNRDQISAWIADNKNYGTIVVLAGVSDLALAEEYALREAVIEAGGVFDPVGPSDPLFLTVLSGWRKRLTASADLNEWSSSWPDSAYEGCSEFREKALGGSFDWSDEDFAELKSRMASSSDA